MKLARGLFEICIGDDVDQEKVNAIIDMVSREIYNAGLIKAVEVYWDFAEPEPDVAAANAVDTVKDQLHGIVSQIKAGLAELNAVHEHVDGAFRSEVLHLRRENARLREVNKSMEAKINRQRAAIRSLLGKAGA